tara:strand:+ start:50 stop:694 length:645 start_codon:yes stop_codon:yes gene_type:complete
MAAIKLKHTSGNGTILHSPAANPSSDVTLKLPSTTGSAGQVLKVASANHSSTNAELEFGADTGGKLLQVVTTNISANFSTTSTSLVDVTGYNLSITPTAASSKIKVSFNADHYAENNNTFNQYSIITIARSIQGGSYTSLYTGAQGAYMKLEQWADNEYGRVAMIFLDAPTYTLGNSITYKMQIRSPDTSVTSAIVYQRSSITASNIILEEIGA